MKLTMLSLQKLFKLMRANNVDTLEIPEVVKIKLGDKEILYAMEEEKEKEEDTDAVLDKYDVWSTSL